jgi:hypothetical protein
MPVDHQRKHAQLHNVLPDEELVTVAVNDKGRQIQAHYKLDHKDKQVFIAGGPEEDSAWKRTNGSYDDILRQVGRSTEPSSVPSPQPIEPVGVPGFSAPESDSE